MVDEPELKTAVRKRSISPLMVAWGVVIILLGLTVAWIAISDETSSTSDQAVNNQEDAAPEAPEQSTAGASSVVELNLPSANSEITDEAPQQRATDAAPSSPTTSTASTIPEPEVEPQREMLVQSQQPLKLAPNENLLVRGDNGLKPALGPDGLIAWKEYARPYEGPEETPRIAIMVADIALNTRSSTMAINNLPGQIDMAFSPYGRNLQDWMDKARAKGHEGFLMIPTEPLNYPDNDPGPHTLITDFSERENLLRLDWILSQVAGYVGVVNHMGSKFTASEEALDPIIADLQNRGLMLVDARSSRFSMAARVARRLNMPRALNDRFIDNVLTKEEIRKQLSELENTAKTFGAALGMARATPLTVNELAAWAQTLDDKGISLVPVTAIANRQPIK